MIKMFQERHLATVAMLHGEGRRFIEEEPSQGRSCIDSYEEVVDTAPAHVGLEHECVANSRSKATKWNTPEEDVALGQKAPSWAQFR